MDTSKVNLDRSSTLHRPSEKIRQICPGLPGAMQRISYFRRTLCGTRVIPWYYPLRLESA